MLTLLAIVSLTVVMFPMNFRLLWNSLALVKRVKVPSEWNGEPFWIVVVTPTGAELLVSPEGLAAYKSTHANYSFLIPDGRKQEVEEQIVSWHRAHCPSCKGTPSLSVSRIDSDHQSIELYMHGDPHDDILWYEASDKEIRPKYWTIIGIPDALLVLILDMGLIPCLYLIGLSIVRLASRWPGRPASFAPLL